MRLRFFICALIVATAAAPWTAPPAFAQKLEKLVIGYPAPVASLGIIDVMRKGGLFRKNGLDVDLVYIQGSPILTAAMVSGQVPLAFLGGAAIVASAIGGADTVYLACGINTLYWRVFSTPDVKTVADLKGKKIGVTTIGSQEDSVDPIHAERAGSSCLTAISRWSQWAGRRRARSLEQGRDSGVHIHSAPGYRRRKARTHS